jgi:integrase
VLFALGTGCRLGEIEALHVGDVLAERGVARIRRSKSGAARTVHVPAEVLEALYGLPARRDGLVFGKLDRRGWRAAKKEAELDEWRFHDLRHDFASRLGRAGASEAVIAAALGHKTWAMARRYTHHAPEEVAELVRGFF